MGLYDLVEHRRVMVFALSGKVTITDDASRNFRRRIHYGVKMASINRLKRVCGDNLRYIGNDTFYGEVPRATATD